MYEPKHATLCTGLKVDYEVPRDGCPFVEITDPESGGTVAMVNSSDFYALRDILCRVAPRSWQFRLWLWRKITFRETRARRRMRRHITAAKATCEALK